MRTEIKGSVSADSDEYLDFSLMRFVDSDMWKLGYLGRNNLSCEEISELRARTR